MERKKCNNKDCSFGTSRFLFSLITNKCPYCHNILVTESQPAFSGQDDFLSYKNHLLDLYLDFINIGLCYFNDHDYDSFIENYESALKILEVFEELDNQYSTRIFDSASKYLESIEGINTDAYNHIYTTLGEAYNSKNQIESAIYYFKKGLDYCNNHFPDNYILITYYHNLIALVYMRNNEWTNAILHLNKQLDIFKVYISLDKQVFSIIYWHLGICHKNITDYVSAIEFFSKGFKIGLDSGGFPYEIAMCYEKINDNQKALDFYFQSIIIRLKTLGIDANETIDSVNEYNRLSISLRQDYLDINTLLNR
jgi:tetratricopeptide (TPR) repeat protein